jgi:hypothetical protein
MSSRIYPIEKYLPARPFKIPTINDENQVGLITYTMEMIMSSIKEQKIRDIIHLINKITSKHCL